MAHDKKNEKNMSRFNLWLTVGAVVVVIVVGIVVVGIKNTKKGGPTPAPVSADQASILKSRPTDWIRGQIAAPVTLIEYSDLQCPACAAYYPLIKKVEQTYPAQVRIIYRHFPLSIHTHSREAASATEAAGNQGKFWEMHDILFENQEKWSDKKDIVEIYKEYAKKIGLDVDRFVTDMKSDEIADRIQKSLAEADALQLQGTPTFFLNGKQIKNPSSLDDFRYLIENAQK